MKPGEKHDDTQPELLERILSRENMLAAYKRVKANKGAPGIDGMTVDQFLDFARQHWDRIRSALYQGSYHPAAVRRVMIPKATGGERPLGIPTVLDRVLQQAISQQLTPIFEPLFHDKSFGFRPGRRARQALAVMEQAHKDGDKFVVDCDLKSFFDVVNHDILLGLLRKHIKDERVIRLIARYLRARVVMPNGEITTSPTGFPQGGPLSPLLSNVMLNELDWELDKRGHRFSRYADDFLIFVKSERAACRVFHSIRRFIEKKLCLVVNEAKSRACPLKKCSFLGFGIHRGKLQWTRKVVKRFRQRVRELTARSNGRNVASKIESLSRYVRGWMNYFGHSHTYSEVLALDGWVRRRVRLCFWKSWKRPRTRRKRLLALGVKMEEVHLATRSRKGYWRMSNNSLLRKALSNDYLWNLGVPNMKQQWIELHYGSKE